MRYAKAKPAELGRYRVLEGRVYRSHKAGDEFEASLTRSAEARAVNRRDIEFLGVITPCLQPGSYTFPEGWLAQPHESIEAPQGAFSLREE